jgi:hypothetical protein
VRRVKEVVCSDYCQMVEIIAGKFGHLVIVAVPFVRT